MRATLLLVGNGRVQRAKVVGWLVCGAALVTLLAACGHGGAKPQDTKSSAPPPLPCPAKGRSVTTSVKGSGTPTTPSKNSSHYVTWSGVFERIFVKTGIDGSPEKTPRQSTYVAVAGQGPTTVDVPMSDSHLSRRPLGKKPNVVDGVAHVHLDPDGSTVQRLKADYERPLPVNVKVTFELDGKPISASDIAGKSGTVEVGYHLANTTPKPVSVCFVGFNGKLVKKTLVEPSPILAYLSLTLPHNVSKVTAPGAFFNADRKGVDPQWIVSLFQPFGPPKQTLRFTMDTPKAKIPTATLLLETFNPGSITGQAPAKSAAAVAKAQASVTAAVAKVQGDLAALQLKASKPGHSSKRSLSANGATTGTSFGISPAAPAQIESWLTAVGQADQGLATRTEQANASVAGSANRSTAGLTARVDESIANLTTSTDRTIRDETARATGSIHLLTADLRRSIGTSSLSRLTANGKRLQLAIRVVSRHVKTLGTDAKSLSTRVGNLVAGLPAPVHDALEVYLAFGQIKQDVGALTGVQTSSAPYLKLVSDLDAGQALARTVSGSLSDLEAEAQGLAGRIRSLGSDVTSLRDKVTALSAASTANAASTAQATLAKEFGGVATRFAATAAAAVRAASADGRNARAQVAIDRTDARRTVTAASGRAGRAVAAELASAKRRVRSAERKAHGELASAEAQAHAALAAAEKKAKHNGQADLAAAQASAATAMAKAQHAFETADDDYAVLLAINQQALANELPGGNATHVTEEDGSLYYTIDGT